MNNYTNANCNSSQLFFTYQPEKNAIYVSPTISANYGYILPISGRSLTGNTYTFIYHQKRSCEMFIAPISQRNNYSKTFVSYKKYNKKLQKYLDNKRSKSYTNIIEIPKQSTVMKKSNTYSDLGGLSKIMEIFDISPSSHRGKWPLSVQDFKSPEPVDSYFFGSSPDDLVEDFVFDD